MGDSTISWWTSGKSNASSETELLSAAVLCAAVTATSSLRSSDADALANDASRRALETHIRTSPLPHRLRLPVLIDTKEYVVLESEQSVICALKSGATGDVVETVLGSTVPLSRPYTYRFGGAKIHTPFWKRAQALDLKTVYSEARKCGKMLLLCGHSIGGSVAQLGMCELVYQHLPSKLQLRLEALDDDAEESESGNASSSTHSSNALETVDEQELQAAMENVPHVMAVGFGAPYIGSKELSAYIELLDVNGRVVTFVNEGDCIPGVLNVAQSAARLAKTTERLVTISKATKSLLNLLPAAMQQCLPGMAEAAGNYAPPSVASAYVSMSLNILQSTFEKLRESNVLKEIDYNYIPCGTYVFMDREGGGYQMHSDADTIAKILDEGEEASGGALTGNSIMQHLMSGYVDSIARRSKSIQINATMDYYERLNISRHATYKEIRKAYKKLALKWHPDRWSGASINPRERESAESVFKLLAEAYEVLSDPKAREEYDEELNKGLSFSEELMRYGTVRGMTLDEAIATFRDVLDSGSAVVSKVTSRFTSSSSTVVGQPLKHHHHNRDLAVGNHENLFAPNRVRVSRTVGAGAEQQDKIMYVEPDDLLPTDVAAPNRSDMAGRHSGALRSISMVGGAVAVGASVALVVSAWSRYSESSKKWRQADAVRKMPAEYLLLLLEDHRTQRQTRNEQLLEHDRKEAMKASGANGRGIVIRPSHEQELAKVGQVEDDMMEEFFDCMTEEDNANLEAMAEEEFFDCLDIAQEMTTFFQDEPDAETQTPIVYDGPVFPPGSTVDSPYGLGTVQEWREKETSAVVYYKEGNMTGYIQKSHLSRGAAQALAVKKDALEDKRKALAEQVVKNYALETQEQGETFRSIVTAGRDGALDSGLRAAGGLALAKSMSRAPILGGSVAAPLTVASILVDVGKEYFEYRKRHMERKAKGILSETSERLMMKDFRMKAAEHVVTGSAAAAGAGISAYGVASAIGLWTGVGITGPIGIAAATGAALAGGMLGMFAGSKAYSGYTAAYFQSHTHAKEHIDRLEVGARILFDEYDPRGKGEISKEDCAQLMSKLFGASEGAVSEEGYESTMRVIQDESFEGPVTWGMFWSWVSAEAARSLQELNKTDTSDDTKGENWWSNYMKYFSYANSNPQKIIAADVVPDQSSMYASVKETLHFKGSSTQAAAKGLLGEEYSEEDSLMILRAQMEFLVASGALSEEDAQTLEEHLTSDDETQRTSAEKTILAFHNAQIDADDGMPMISEGFGGEEEEETSTTIVPKHEQQVVETKRSEAKQKVKQMSKEDQELDVLCSLLSTQGLQQYLHSQNVVSADACNHEDLHCLALQNAAPPTL